MATDALQELELDGQPVAYRRAGDDPVPDLYLHGVPTSSDDWVPFLEAGGGLAPDLPGFGRSGKRGDLDFTMEGLGRFVGRFLDALEIERVRLVVHDWGSVGLLWAAGAPERVERLVVINAVPFLPGYRWHRWARLWRTPGIGEVTIGLMTARPAIRMLGREGNVAPLPPTMLETVREHFDQGTQRAILRLYRSAPEERLAAAGERLAALRGIPSLVLWGADDPYLAPAFGAAYADALGARLEPVERAGHWPWLDRPELVPEIVRFLHA